MFQVGILAPGRIAHTMAQTLNAMPDVKLAAVGSRNLERAKAFADQYQVDKAYGSYEELVQDPELDLIYIASPHSHHYEHMKLCIAHGKNVLCEKSFTVNAAQAEEVLALAKEKGVLVTEAMWVRYLPLRATLEQVLNENPIGEITTVTANLCYSVDEKARITDPKLAGGALLDVGVYTLTFASIALGADPTQISAVAIPSPAGIDNQVAITAVYPGEKMAVLHSGVQSVSDRQGILYGRDGFIIVDNINNFESIRVFNADYQQVAHYDRPTQITGFEYQVEACKKAIENGLTECPQMPHAQTVSIMRQMDEVRRQINLQYPFEA